MVKIIIALILVAAIGWAAFEEYNRLAHKRRVERRNRDIKQSHKK
jgi:hypothetical protein